MALELTGLAPWSYLVVGVLAGLMAWLSWRSYESTGNVKLLFIVIAFVAIVLKSLLVMVNEWDPGHPIGHHSLIVIMGLFDVLIVLLFFVPFLTPRPPRNG